MAVKKSADKATDREIRQVEEKAIDTVSSASVPQAEKSAQKEAGFCVYLGPTIIGVIQSGTVYPGSRESTEKRLASAIERYPLIARLIVADSTFAEDRIKVKIPGNALYGFYARLASGKM